MPLFKNNMGDYVLFIHIPKAGGTSIKSTIVESTPYLMSSKTKGDLPASPQHFHSDLLRQLGLEEIASESFTIVREPLDRLLSEFKYRKMNNQLIRGFFDFDTFVKFIFLGYNRNKFILDNHIRPQSEFLLESTYVFKLEEDFDSVLMYVSRCLGQKVYPEMKHVNKSEEEDITMSRSTAQMIVGFYQMDYRRFGYELPSLSAYRKAGVFQSFFSTFKAVSYYALFVLLKVIQKI